MHDYLSAEQKSEFARWLKAAGPDDWHRVANSWNWDSNPYHLRWIIKQPDCDISTALLVFWRSDPLWNLRALNPNQPPQMREASIDAQTIDLQIEILRRWVTEGFQRCDIAFQGEKIPEGHLAAIAPLVAGSVSHEMAKTRPGRTIARGAFDEGIPHHIAYPDVSG